MAFKNILYKINGNRNEYFNCWFIFMKVFLNLTNISEWRSFLINTVTWLWC
jgi:hypothetical protein